MRSATLMGALSTALLFAQSPAGPQLASFHSEVDDSQQPYGLYVPRILEPGRRYPLVISLHDEDSNHRINLRRIFGTAGRTGEIDSGNLRNFPAVRDVDFFVAARLARGTMGYQGIAERDVYDVLADVERRFPIDEDRVYLTGISMGGAGALWLALTRPGLWAAVAAVCPGGMPGAEELAGNALNLPIRFFHGDLDPIVPVSTSRAWHRRFLDLGIAADYLEYPGVRHNSWEQAYRDEAIFEWFSQFRRNRFPQRVRFATRSYRYESACWVPSAGLAPGIRRFMDAEWTGPAALKITTENAEAFTVTPEKAPSSPVIVNIDGTTLRVKPAGRWSFVKTAGRWREGSYTPPGKRPGAEGPIAEAVAGQQVYVYGSGGRASPAELEHRRPLAEPAAPWSTSRQKLALKLPVKADTAVTEEDIASADLILFGTAETNSVIAQFSSRLPLALSPAAADYGLLFIAPVGRHYALVSSGLPWWTGAEEVDTGGYPRAPTRNRLLSTLGDYILFKGSVGNVIAAGRFDQNWKVPAEAASRIRASGTVMVR